MVVGLLRIVLRRASQVAGHCCLMLVMVSMPLESKCSRVWGGIQNCLESWVLNILDRVVPSWRAYKNLQLLLWTAAI
jgi:hypothetical protein